MTLSSGNRRDNGALIVLFAVITVLVAGSTAVLLSQDDGIVPSRVLDLLSPGAIGELLIGGVHSVHPAWADLAAWSVANGLIWASAIVVIAVLFRTLAKRRRM